MTRRQFIGICGGSTLSLLIPNITNSLPDVEVNTSQWSTNLKQEAHEILQGYRYEVFQIDIQSITESQEFQLWLGEIFTESNIPWWFSRIDITDESITFPPLAFTGDPEFVPLIDRTERPNRNGMAILEAV